MTIQDAGDLIMGLGFVCQYHSSITFKIAQGE
jgi:hypothetical protein